MRSISISAGVDNKQNAAVGHLQLSGAVDDDATTTSPSTLLLSKLLWCYKSRQFTRLEASQSQQLHQLTEIHCNDLFNVTVCIHCVWCNMSTLDTAHRLCEITQPSMTTNNRDTIQISTPKLKHSYSLTCYISDTV